MLVESNIFIQGSFNCLVFNLNIMKNLLLGVTIILLNVHGACQGHSYQFEGKISNSSLIADTLYVCKINHILDFYSGNSGLIIKKVPLINGMFSFMLNVDSVESRIIRLNIQRRTVSNGASVQRGGSAENCFFIILDDNDSMRLTADALDFVGTFEVSPNRANNSLRQLRNILKERNRIADSISNLLSKSQGEIQNIDQLKTIYYNRLLADRPSIKLFVDTVENIYSKLVGLHQMDIPHSLNDSIMYNFCRDLLIHLSARIQDTYLLNSFNELLKTYDRQAYKLNNLLKTRFNVISGEIAKITLKKRLTLIDFWASWCEPCRKANRSELQTINDLAKTKDFEIISICLDKQRNLWFEASKKDQIKWKNYLDPLNFQSDYINDLQIRELPSAYLVDIHGQVIARDIALPELIKLLK